MNRNFNIKSDNNCKFTEKEIRNYLQKCYKEVCTKAGKSCMDINKYFDYVLIKNSKGKYQMYPVVEYFDLPMYKSLCKVIKATIEDKLGIYYQDTEDLSCIIHGDGSIDTNYTKIMIKTAYRNLSFSVFDDKTRQYEIKPTSGKHSELNTYEKLLLKYYDMTYKEYQSLSEDDIRQNIPDTLFEDWEAFKNLYKGTFNTYPGEEYEVICSSGIQCI